MAYVADPTLLDDHVLLRYRETTGVRYLRDLRGRAWRRRSPLDTAETPASRVSSPTISRR